MKDVRYYCELCKEQKKEQGFFSIFWSATVQIGDKFGGYILSDKLEDSPKHICLNCIKLIKEVKL